MLIFLQVTKLRESHAFQEGKRNELRKTHGELWDEFERVARELERLGNELHVMSEHAVNLDANFSKYGYSAHLRTIPRSGSTSAATSVYEDHEKHWSSEAGNRESGEYITFFQRPVIRQYFHKGLLWRAEEMAEVASYELFIDLFYVGILAIAGDNAAEGATGQALLKYVIVFILAWKIWGEVGTYMSWIAADDIIRRLSVLVFLVMLLGVTTNMADSWEVTYPPMIGFYIAARWYSALYYLFTGYMIPMVRNSMIATSVINFIPGLLWIGSIHTHEPNRQALIWIALFIDIFGPVILVLFERGGAWMGPKFSNLMKSTFEFMPGANIEHKIERTNAFVSLVFGYSVVALLYQSATVDPLNAFYGKAALGLIMAFSFNWMYFEIDTFNMHTHAIRHHFLASKWKRWFSRLESATNQDPGFIWISSHLPFTMAYTLAGSALSKIVLAHDTVESEAEMLFEPYNTRSEEHIPIALMWYYCGGIGTALFCMALISMSHASKTIPNARLTKPIRLVIRALVGIAIMLLPLAHEHLDSLELVAIVTCMVVFVLMIDLAGTSCHGQVFWGFRNCDSKARYSARCEMSRKEMAEKVRTGEIVNVEELAAKNRQKGGTGVGIEV
jgi:low temperature requirement protein LtrA